MCDRNEKNSGDGCSICACAILEKKGGANRAVKADMGDQGCMGSVY